MPSTVILASEEYGQEAFHYDTLREAEEGLERLKVSALEHFRSDGIVRILVLEGKEYTTGEMPSRFTNGS